MTEHSETPAIDSAKYRQVLGHFPTGVVIVTAMTTDGPAGMAIGSFSSGTLLEVYGWATVNEVVFPVVLAAAALLAWGTLRGGSLPKAA